MVKFNSAIGPMRGSVGALTFSHGRGGDIIKRKTSPVQPKTPAQTRSQSLLAGTSKGFSYDLTPAQRDGWKELADAHPEDDTFGNPITLTGQNWYVRLNTALVAAGESSISDAPEDLNVTELTGVQDLGVFAGIRDIEFEFSPAIGALELLRVEIAYNISTGVEFVKDKFRFLEFTPKAQTTPRVTVLPDDWALPIDGLVAWVRVTVLNTVNGVKSVPVVWSQVQTAPPP